MALFPRLWAGTFIEAVLVSDHRVELVFDFPAFGRGTFIAVSLPLKLPPP